MILLTLLPAGHPWGLYATGAALFGFAVWCFFKDAS
jgi:hypothetical protein